MFFGVSIRAWFTLAFVSILYNGPRTSGSRAATLRFGHTFAQNIITIFFGNFGVTISSPSVNTAFAIWRQREIFRTFAPVTSDSIYTFTS